MEESFRPIIELDIFPECRALIDTGAELPVWTGEERLLGALDGVSYTGIREAVKGFGGASEGNIYRMTLDFVGLYYIEMPIIACRMENEPYHIILPATMFDGMKYTIDNIRREMIFEVPDNQPVRHLKYRDKDGRTYILSQETPQKHLA